MPRRKTLPAIMKKEKIIGLIGIGIFMCLILQAISFLSFKIIEKSLLFTEMKSMLLYGASKYLSLGITLLSFLLIIKKLKKFDFDNTSILKRIFIFSILGYVASQIIEFAFPFITSSFETPEYLSSLKNYYDGLEGKSMFKELTIDTPVWVLEYIVIIIIVIKELKPMREKK